MTPGTYNITIYKGGTWSVSLSAKDVDENPIDFSQYDSLRMQIRPSWVTGTPSGSPLLELTDGNGRITLQNANTEIVLTVSAEDTTVLTFDEGKYELELVKDAVIDPATDEIVDKLLRGTVTVIGETAV